MVKLGIYYEQDKEGKDTGRVQVASVAKDGEVFGTYNTEEEAEKEMAKMQAEFDQDDKIEAEYLEWERACLVRHKISKDELRELLVNYVII